MLRSAVYVALIVMSGLSIQPGPVGSGSASGLGTAGAGTVRSPGSTPATTAATGRYVVVLADGTDAVKVARDHARRFGVNAFLYYRNALSGYAAFIDPGQVASLEAEPLVEWVEVDIDERPPGIQVAPQPEQVESFFVGRIDADESSAISGDGKGSVNVNVAVLDTGVQPDHPDLNVVNGYNCIGADPKAWADPTSGVGISGHGTMVSGFLAARDNKIGRVGAAPGARISAVRVLDADGYGFTSEVVCGLDWVAGTRSDGKSGNDIAVANMSLAGTEIDDGACGSIAHRSLHRAICGVVASGVTVVGSAGNEGFDLQGLGPASFSEILTVTAMADRDAMPGGLGGVFTCDPDQFDDTIAYWSNFTTLPSDGAHVVSAPGVCMGTTFVGSIYAVGSGTSFSSPIAAGVVALCIASGPCEGLTPAQIVAKIVADAEAYNLANPSYGYAGDPLRPIGDRYYGYLVNAGIY